ncbi:hypothetical protein D3C83_78600 [compost metagenome]
MARTTIHHTRNRSIMPRNLAMKLVSSNIGSNAPRFATPVDMTPRAYMMGAANAAPSVEITVE